MNLKTFVFVFALIFTADAAFCQYSRPGSYYRTVRSYEQYGSTGKKWLKRQYITLGMPFMELQFDAKYQEHPLSGPTNDTAMNISKKSSGSYGISVGSFANIARLNETQMIALDLSFGGYYYQFNLADYKDSYGEDVSVKAMSMLFELPIGLEYKSGGEASLNPKHKLLFSMGAGFAPTLAVTAYGFVNGDATGGIAAKMRTYVMAEMGMHFGFALKLRGTYYTRPFIMYNATDGDIVNGLSTVTLKGRNNFVLSLVILPFSWKWGDEGQY